MRSTGKKVGERERERRSRQSDAEEITEVFGMQGIGRPHPSKRKTTSLKRQKRLLATKKWIEPHPNQGTKELVGNVAVDEK